MQNDPAERPAAVESGPRSLQVSLLHCCKRNHTAPIREGGGRRIFLFGLPLVQGSTSPCAVPSFKSCLMPILFCFLPTNSWILALPPPSLTQLGLDCIRA